MAVLRLMISSNAVAGRTGRSAGFVPLRIWPAQVRVAIGVGEARAVGDELAEWVDRGKPVTRRQPDDLFSSIEFLRVVLLFCAFAGAFSPSVGRQFPLCNPGRPKS